MQATPKNNTILLAKLVKKICKYVHSSQFLSWQRQTCEFTLFSNTLHIIIYYIIFKQQNVSSSFAGASTSHCSVNNLHGCKNHITLHHLTPDYACKLKIFMSKCCCKVEKIWHISWNTNLTMRAEAVKFGQLGFSLQNALICNYIICAIINNANCFLELGNAVWCCNLWAIKLQHVERRDRLLQKVFNLTQPVKDRQQSRCVFIAHFTIRRELDFALKTMSEVLQATNLFNNETHLLLHQQPIIWRRYSTP